MTTPTSVSGLPADSVLLWPPLGAGDFAAAARVIGEALGNMPGVRGLDVSRGRPPPTSASVTRDGLYARVWTTGPEYVGSVAAAFGWEVYAPDPAYASTWGQVGGVKVSVSWVAPSPDPVEGQG